MMNNSLGGKTVMKVKRGFEQNYQGGPGYAKNVGVLLRGFVMLGSTFGALSGCLKALEHGNNVPKGK